jgi:hypothetical protein
VSAIAKAMEGAKNLERRPRGTPRRRGSGMLGKLSGNRGDLPRSRGHNLRKSWDKPGEAKSGAMSRARSEGIIVPGRRGTT